MLLILVFKIVVVVELIYVKMTMPVIMEKKENVIILNMLHVIVKVMLWMVIVIVMVIF